MKQRLNQFIRIAFSLFIVFHLIVIVVLSNGGSYYGRALSPYLTSYANVIGLNSSWNFFSPDPANSMYLRVSLLNGDDYHEEFYPPGKEKFEWSGNQRRFLYFVRYMLVDPSRIESFLIPWFCKTHPGTERISVDFVIQPIPSLDKARFVMDLADLHEDYDNPYKYLNRTMGCETL